MKQPINSSVFIGIVTAFVVIAAAIVVWVWRAPPSALAPSSSEASASSSGSPGGKAERSAAIMAAMKAAHSGPTPSERQQLEEWKSTHPDGYTKR